MPMSSNLFLQSSDSAFCLIRALVSQRHTRLPLTLHGFWSFKLKSLHLSVRSLTHCSISPDAGATESSTNKRGKNQPRGKCIRRRGWKIQNRHPNGQTICKTETSPNHVRVIATLLVILWMENVSHKHMYLNKDVFPVFRKVMEPLGEAVLLEDAGSGL